MTAVQRTQLRRAPLGWACLAVFVAVVVLLFRAGAVAVVFTVTVVERLVAVAVVVAEWVDERASDRAGLSVVGAPVVEVGRWPR